MKGPVRYLRRHITYTGQLDRESYHKWCYTLEAQAVVEPIADSLRFALFGRMRAARRMVWREATAAARSADVQSLAQREIDSYLERIEPVFYADDLPRLTIELHRLVVVPRLFANGALDRRLDAALDAEPAFATTRGRKPLRDWVALSIVESVERAVIDARPSPRQPLTCGDEWIMIGVNDRFDWRVPFKGPAWPGHYYMFEVTRQPITRAVRDAAADAITRLEAALPSLSRARRDDILRKASAGYTQRPALLDHSSCTVY